MYCLYVNMCTVLLPPGGYPIAVKYIISYHIIPYHIITCLFKVLSTLETSTNILAVYEKRVLNFCEFRQDNNDLSPTDVGSGPND